MQGFAVAILISGSFLTTEQSADFKMPIRMVIDGFNLTRRSELMRLKQPLLSEDEVIAGIRAWMSKKEASDNALLFAIMSRIEQTRILPPKSKFEVIRLTDSGGKYVFDVYHIHLGVQLPNGLSSGIRLRQSFISSRTLQEEVDRLKKVLSKTSPQPGLYRLENRVKELKKRMRSKNTK